MSKKKAKKRELKVQHITLDFKGVLREIHFRHVPEVVTATGALGEAIVCSIYSHNGTTTITGRSVRHPSDKFSEFYGEKLALQDAFDQAYFQAKELSRKGRTALWQAFLLAHKDSKKISHPRPAKKGKKKKKK